MCVIMAFFDFASTLYSCLGDNKVIGLLIDSENEFF